MAILENLLECLKIDEELSPSLFRYSVYGKRGGWFEGVKIESYAPSETVFLFKGGKIKVKGKDLSVRKYFENEVSLSGEIISIEVL